MEEKHRKEFYKLGQQIKRQDDKQDENKNLLTELTKRVDKQDEHKTLLVELTKKLDNLRKELVPEKESHEPN